MKKILLVISFISLSAVSLFAQKENPQLKIGFVDSQVMLQSLPEAVKAQGDLDIISKRWYAEIDSMGQNLQQQYADYQKQQGTMKADKMKEVQQNLVAKEQELNAYRQRKFGQGGDLYKKQEELLAPIKEKIIKGIKDVAKEEGMSFVFDKSGDIVLLYADTAFDITYKVLDKLKRGK